MPSLMKARSGVLNSNVGGNALAPLFSTGSLTTANLITDVTRLAGVQGDGAAYPDSSVGVWPAATQYVKNSQAVTNTTGWAVNGTGADTPARSTAQAKFGSTSLLIGGTGVAATQGATYSGTDAGSAAVGETWTAVVWAYVVSGTVELGIYLSERDAGGGDLVTSASGGTNVSQGWTKITYTYTLVNASVSKVYPKVVTISNPGAAWQAYIQVNLFKSAIALPYLVADGGTASRVAGRITLPVSGIFTATQGWFIARVKTGFAAAGPGYVPRLMSYGDATDDFIAMYYESGLWKVVSDATGGAVAAVSTIADAGLVVGDSRTIYGGWVSDRVNVTLGTTAWGAGTARSEIPTVASTVIDIGSLTAILAGREAACTFDWVVMGDGLYTAIDPSIVGNWGDNDPLPYMLPRAAQPTALWAANGDGTLYRYAP